MAQLFRPSANTIAKGSIFAIVIVATIAGLILWYIENSSYVTWAGIVREQPIPFSHRAHVSKGLECKGCHPVPEPGDFATTPETGLCMGCHRTVKKDSAAIQRLAELATPNSASQSPSGQAVSGNKGEEIVTGLS